METQNPTGFNWIGGVWEQGEGADWERLSPSDLGLVWRGKWASDDQMARAITAARKAFPAWSDSSLDERMAVCRKFAAYVTQRKDDLAHVIATEIGKPLWEANTEVAAAIAKVETSIDALMKRRWTTTETIGDYMAVTRFRPHGVMLVLGPFNFPAHIPGGHIIPALLAGNTVVFKPSELAPNTGEWLARAWEAAGLTGGVLNLVHGGAEVATTGVESDGVDGVLFTGSHRAGVSIHRAMAGRPDKVLALEMGGNNALVVHHTGDLRGAAITAILSAFLTSGQRCTCARRLIVSGPSDFLRLVELLTELMPKVVCGLPFDDKQPFMGPLIHAQAAQHMLQTQQRWLESGAQAIVQMQSDSRSEALVSPGLLAMDGEQIIDDCEHFGPLLVIQQANDFDEAIALANATHFGLSAGLIGDRVEDFHYFLHHIRAGVVNWNRQTTGASGKLPFGGVGLSGNHHPSGYFAADYCSYPMASLESHELTDARKPVPGLPF